VTAASHDTNDLISDDFVLLLFTETICEKTVLA